VELVVLVALVMLIGGFIVQGTRGGVMIAVGLVLGAMAGLELSIREHFAGYRSHTLLIAGFAAVATLAFLAYVVPSLLAPEIRVGAAVAVFIASAWALTRAFQHRSGVSFKLR
jgi:hypothetical protein